LPYAARKLQETSGPSSLSPRPSSCSNPSTRPRLSKIYKEKKLKKHKEAYSDEAITDWCFDIFLQKNEQNLVHYFKQISYLMKYADSSPDNGDKYVDLVMSQLSSRELCIIFYYVSTGRDEVLKGIFEKRAAFQSLPVKYLLNDEHKNRVSSSAFGVDYNTKETVRKPPGL